MSTPFSQRWAVLLAMPLALSTPVIHLATATAANHHLTATVQLPLQDAFGAPTLVAERSSSLITRRSTSLLAQRSRIQRVRFAPGADSATIKTSVLNGTRDLYLVGAQKGQIMSIRIVSLEDNAVFDIVAPPNGAGKRQTLKQEAFTWSSTLPETGDYQIVVGSTRGNASYRLQVTIR
ncbi:MAG: hypothetical protein KME45_21295 [Stenomitos rutilans HA7619-LM2]|nr:hypothetical protein [Stenomitos rutilans HA7619-LM2]